MDCYLRFVGEAFFMLNLQGLGLSQPYRLQDACSTDTAVVSEAIFTDASRNFPAYFISSNTHAGTRFVLPLNGSMAAMDESKRSEIMHLFSEHLSIYAKLLPQQRAWCQSRFRMKHTSTCCSDTYPGSRLRRSCAKLMTRCYMLSTKGKPLSCSVLILACRSWSDGTVASDAFGVKSAGS